MHYLIVVLTLLTVGFSSLTEGSTERQERHALKLQVTETVTPSPRLVKALHLLSKDYKKINELGLDNLAYWYAYAGKMYGVDPVLLVSKTAIESSFNHKAKSNHGAIGITQVVPKHWGYTKQELLDYRTSILAGAEVASVYRSKCGGNMRCAMQMYNVGETAYAKGKRNAKYTQRINRVLSYVGGRKL